MEAVMATSRRNSARVDGNKGQTNFAKDMPKVAKYTVSWQSFLDRPDAPGFKGPIRFAWLISA